MSIKEIFSKIEKPFKPVLEGWFEFNANSKSQGFFNVSDKF